MARKYFIKEPVYNYLVAHSVQEEKPLQNIRNATQLLRGRSMLLTPEQAQFMKVLIHLTGAKKMLEIGTYTGYSALNMALAGGENAHVTTIDFNPQWYETARPHWESAGCAERIQQLHGQALDILPSFPEAHFDLVFIDADKENTQSYYEQALRLTKPNGIILIDNVLMWGEVADPTVEKTMIRKLRLFNKNLHEDPRVEISILPFADGMTLALKRP